MQTGCWIKYKYHGPICREGAGSKMNIMGPYVSHMQTGCWVKYEHHDYTLVCPKDADRMANNEDRSVWSGSTLFAQTSVSQYLESVHHTSPMTIAFPNICWKASLIAPTLFSFVDVTAIHISPPVPENDIWALSQENLSLGFLTR